MAQLLTGKQVNDMLVPAIRQKADALRVNGLEPVLGVIRIGEREDDLAYERGLTKKAEACGVTVKKTVLPLDTSVDQVLAALDAYNQDPLVHGVLLFRPLPMHLKPFARQIEERLFPAKDVDAQTSASAASVYLGAGEGFAPCTAQACIEMLKAYGFALDGKRVAVVGRSAVIGKPVSMLLLRENATVTICHTHTKEIASHLKEADIIISAAGKANSLRTEYVRPGHIVLDVSVNMDEDGAVCGDSEPGVYDVVDYLTPSRGGIGAVTTTILMDHTVEAAMRSLQG